VYHLYFFDTFTVGENPYGVNFILTQNKLNKVLSNNLEKITIKVERNGKGSSSIRKRKFRLVLEFLSR
jgi:hypothetical protein